MVSYVATNSITAIKTNVCEELKFFAVPINRYAGADSTAVCWFVLSAPPYYAVHVPSSEMKDHNEENSAYTTAQNIKKEKYLKQEWRSSQHKLGEKEVVPLRERWKQ